MTRWCKYSLDETQELRRAPGCYVWMCDGRAMYVGQSVNVRARVQHHDVNYARYFDAIDTPWGRFPVGAVILKVRYSRRFGDWLMWEARLIKALRPAGNCIGGTKPRVFTGLRSRPLASHG